MMNAVGLVLGVPGIRRKGAMRTNWVRSVMEASAHSPGERKGIGYCQGRGRSMEATTG